MTSLKNIPLHELLPDLELRYGWDGRADLVASASFPLAPYVQVGLFKFYKLVQVVSATGSTLLNGWSPAHMLNTTLTTYCEGFTRTHRRLLVTNDTLCFLYNRAVSDTLITPDHTHYGKNPPGSWRCTAQHLALTAATRLAHDISKKF